MIGASEGIAVRMFSMVCPSLRDVPAHVFVAFEHEALVWQPLATHVVDGPRAAEIVFWRELLDDAQRGDHGFARAFAVRAGRNQRLAGAARGGLVEIRAHELAVILLALSR